MEPKRHPKPWKIEPKGNQNEQQKPSMTPFRNMVEQVSKKNAERGSAALALGSHLNTQIQKQSQKTRPRKHTQINHGKT